MQNDYVKGIENTTVFIVREYLRKEAKKCKLLCPNCHYEITFPE